MTATFRCSAFIDGIPASGGSNSWSYRYDHAGRMTGATHGSESVSYAYDALGNRVGRTANGAGGAVTSDERYAVDAWDTAKPESVGTESSATWADLDASGNVTSRRLFGPGFDEPVARVDGGSSAASWYGSDGRGSVTSVFTTAGTVTGSRSYAAFGAVTAESGAGLDRYGYTAREWDGVAGLQYSRGRMYDPTGGVFTGEDPMGFAAGDPNLRRYVGNAPTNRADPSGLWWTDDRSNSFNPFSTDPIVQVWRELRKHGVEAELFSYKISTFGPRHTGIYAHYGYRDKLRAALPKIWPGLTDAEYDHHTMAMFKDMGDSNIVAVGGLSITYDSNTSDPLTSDELVDVENSILYHHASFLRRNPPRPQGGTITAGPPRSAEEALARRITAAYQSGDNWEMANVFIGPGGVWDATAPALLRPGGGPGRQGWVQPPEVVATRPYTPPRHCPTALPVGSPRPGPYTNPVTAAEYPTVEAMRVAHTARLPGAPAAATRESLLGELATKGVKHTPDKVVAIAKDGTGKVVFLEQGNAKAGLQHIVDQHGADFARRGIPAEQIPDAVLAAATRGKPVGFQGAGTGRPIYEVEFNGQTHRIAVTVGDNGFIVGANPAAK